MTTAVSKKIRLGEALVEEGLLTREQLERALGEQKASGRMLGELLIEQGLVSAEAMVDALAKRLGVPGCRLRPGLIDLAAVKLIGAEEAQRLKAIPLFKVHSTLTVAMAEPQSLPTIDRLEQLTGCTVRPVFALESDIASHIKKHAQGDEDVQSLLSSISGAELAAAERETDDEGPALDLDRKAESNPVVKLVNLTLLGAIRDGASDIHVEPDKTGTRIRYRIDGVLHELMKPPAGIHAAIVSRFKVLGRMDIAEKRLPQEGRVKVLSRGREIDLRLSSMPTLLGEKLVIRLLDKANLNVDLGQMGFRPQALEVFKRVLRQPHGLVLVTGPTGSGKTTTLYSALDVLKSPGVNIVTVEDPVEYQLDGINQVQVQASIGMTFARALRSILRQDPDIIMVGEVRDEETARIAVQAALTGHLVLATLHTNDAPSTIARLQDMRIEPFLLASALNGVVAQRLARRVCSGCATDDRPEPQALAEAGLEASVDRPFRKGQGCERCHQSGFQGRVGVYEVMEITPGLRKLIHRGEGTHVLREQLRKQGAMTLREEGALLALEGKTSLEEVLRVTHTDDEAPVDEGGAHGAAGLTPPRGPAACT
jgi:type IV pilus assembly protein PilB